MRHFYHEAFCFVTFVQYKFHLSVGALFDPDNIVTIQNPCFCYRYESSCLGKGDDNDLESWISNFAFPNVKSVKLVYSTGMCHEPHDRLFELSEFLLKKAIVLEKFVIIAKRRKCRKCFQNCVSPYSLQLAANLLGCPRPSTNFMMIFHESDSK